VTELSNSWNVLVSAPYTLTRVDRFLTWIEDYGIEPVIPSAEEGMGKGRALKVNADLDGRCL